MRNRRKLEEPHEEGSPAWMNTYGDMVTLLLAFFVLLFSFSTIDAEKWQDIVESFSGTQIVAITPLDPNAPETDEESDGKYVITASTPMPTETSEIGAINDANVDEIKERFEELYEKIKTHIEENHLGYILNVEYIDDDTILLRMSDSAFFDSGQAKISVEAKVALSEVCNIIVEYTDLIQMIHIEGHTDNVPQGGPEYEDNWELSYGRADTVRKYIFSETDIDPEIVSVTYYSEYHPVADNDTEEGRRQNRRVDFVIESILKD